MYLQVIIHDTWYFQEIRLVSPQQDLNKEK